MSVLRSGWRVAVLAVGAGLAAQTATRPALAVDDLLVADPIAVEIACRKLALADPRQLDRARLEALLRGDPKVAEAARRVLVRHGLLVEADEFARGSWDARRALASGRSAAADAFRRRIVWAEAPLPAGFFASVRAEDRAAWLSVLADRPRAEARPLVDATLAVSLAEIPRLLAIAALPPPAIRGAYLEEIERGLESLDAEVFAAACLAAQRLEPTVADGVIARLVRDPATAKRPMQVLMSLGARVSVQGLSEVLDFALRSEDANVRRELLGWLDGRGSAELASRVEAALDGEIPLRLELLERSGPHLDRPGRIERVAKLLASEDPRMVEAAEGAFLKAGIFVPGLLEIGDPSPRRRLDRLQRVLRLPSSTLPVEVVRRLLQDRDPAVACAACLALGSAPDLRGSAEVLATLVSAPEPALARAARAALLAHGSDEDAKRAWSSLRTDEDRLAALTWLVGRARPFAPEVLGAELARLERDGITTAEASELHEALLVETARLGVLASRERLVAGLGTVTITTLRRARSALAAGLRPVEVAAVLALASDPTLGKQPQRRGELLALLATRPEFVDVPKVEAIFATDTDPEVRLAALRLLLTTSGAATILERLLPALRGTRVVDEETKDELYEYVGAFRLPLPREGVLAVLRMALLAPLGDARSELESALALRGTEAEVAFSEQTMLVGLLMRSDAELVGSVAREVVAEAKQHPAAFALSRRRLAAFLEQLGARPELLRAAGPPVAGLLLFAPDADDAGLGLAHLVLGDSHAALGEHREAGEAWRRALLCFARAPLSTRLEARFLGDRDLVEDAHPLVALAARAHLAFARAATDPTSRDSELERASILALGDRASEEAVRQLRKELKR